MYSTIVTQRLVLRRPVIEELEEYFGLFSRPELHLYNPTGPDTDISQTEETLRTWIADWESEGVGYFSVRLRDEAWLEVSNSGSAVQAHRDAPELVGYVGVAKRKFDEETSVLNLAYRIHPEYQGGGLVTEACRAVLREAQESYPNLRIRAYTKAENQPSRKVAERLGFSYHPELDNYPEVGDVNYFLD